MKIVIAGNYGAGNIGDEMILEGMLNSVRLFCDCKDITVLSANPSETGKKYKVKSVNKFPSGLRSLFKNNLKKTKEAVRNCDYFILGGGGLFGSLSFMGNIIWGIQAFWAYFYKKKVIMYGQSIGELNGFIRKWIVRRIFQKAHLIAVRDSESKNILKKIGITKKIHTIPDLAFNIDFHKNNNSRRELIVALRQSNKITSEFIIHLIDYLNWVTQDLKWKVKFVNFQSSQSHDADKILHEKIIESLIDQEKVSYIRNVKDSKELSEIYKKAGLVLGMRLHSIIMAIKSETPFIGIKYAPKVRNLLIDSDLLNYALNPSTLTTDELILLTTQITKSPAKVRGKLHTVNSEIEKKQKNFLSSTVCKLFTDKT